MKNQLIILPFFLAFCQSIYPQNTSGPTKSDSISKALSELVHSGKATGMIAAIASSEGVIAMGSAGVRKVGSDVIIEPVGFYAGGWGIIEDRPWSKGKMLTHTGSNGIWYASVIVATKIDRAYVVVTNSRDFNSTEGICAQMINKQITMDLGTYGG